MGIAHFEIHADDPGRAARFYGDLFGWSVQAFGPDYLEISSGGQSLGGIVKRRGQKPSEDAPVNGYVCTTLVESYDEAAGKIAGLGGHNVVEKSHLPGVGHYGYFKDTEGNIFGILQGE